MRSGKKAATFKVTADGRTVVADARALLDQPHVKSLIKSISKKVQAEIAAEGRERATGSS
jgi:hypothetical protein